MYIFQDEVFFLCEVQTVCVVWQAKHCTPQFLRAISWKLFLVYLMKLKILTRNRVN